jgi:hypothetical protein
LSQLTEGAGQDHPRRARPCADAAARPLPARHGRAVPLRQPAVSTAGRWKKPPTVRAVQAEFCDLHRQCAVAGAGELLADERVESGAVQAALRPVRGNGGQQGKPLAGEAFDRATCWRRVLKPLAVRFANVGHRPAAAIDQ